jgi:hypothetical protein
MSASPSEAGQIRDSTSLPQFPAYECNTGEVVDLITGRVYTAVDTIRTFHDAVDTEDPALPTSCISSSTGWRSWAG